MNNDLLHHQQTLYESKNPTRRWLHCTRRDWIIYAIKKYANIKDMICMEIGPGSGVYLPILAKVSKKVTALDIEMSYLNNAKILLKKYNNIEIIAADILYNNIPSATYDLILCSEVIEHIEDPSKAIKEIYRILKPGGILILSTPQKFSFMEMTAKIATIPGIISIVKYIYKESVIDLGHIHLLTQKKLLKIISNIRFEILQMHKSGLYLPIIAEIFGRKGLEIERTLENKIVNNNFLNWQLWTQYYVLKK